MIKSKIKSWFLNWKYGVSSERPTMNYYKYNVGQSAYYKLEKVQILGIKTIRHMSGNIYIADRTETCYKIRVRGRFHDCFDYIWVNENDLSEHFNKSYVF